MANTDNADVGAFGEILEVYRQEVSDAHQRLARQMLDTQQKLRALCSVLGEPGELLADNVPAVDAADGVLLAAETFGLRHLVNELKTEVAQLRSQESWAVAANQDLSERLVELRAEQRGHAVELERLREANGELLTALAAVQGELEAVHKQNTLLVKQLSGEVQGKPLGRVLVEARALSEEQLADALAEQQESGGLLGEILVSRGLSSEDEIAQCVAGQLELPLVRLFDSLVDAGSVASTGVAFWREHGCVPLRGAGERLVVAMANPRDEGAIARIERKTGRGVARCIATRREIEGTLAHVNCA